MSERKTKIRSFLGRFFRNHEVADDHDIFSLGFVNSLLAIQLVNFIEKEFGVRLDDDDLDLDNFRTIDRIDALVESKTSAHVGA